MAATVATVPAAILDPMTFDLTAVQEALREHRLDGWLLYDFHGSNPIMILWHGLYSPEWILRRLHLLMIQ